MIAIIDYEAGNLASVERAVRYVGYECKVTADVSEVKQAERIIFPGVGAAGSAMKSLKRSGLDEAVSWSFSQGKPVLGICLGTQIIMCYSQENDTVCMGLIDGEVHAFPEPLLDEDGNVLKIPHMGWNRLVEAKPHPVLDGLTETDEFYFVHGYYPAPANPEHILAQTDYGIRFPSVAGFRNIIATQFHLEKSGRPGLRILKNFCEWKPC